jgi:hypothetical protein
VEKKVFVVRVHTHLPIELFQKDDQEPLRAIWLAYKQVRAQLDQENRLNPKNLELTAEYAELHGEEIFRLLREQPFYREIPAPVIDDKMIPAADEEFAMDVDLWLLGGFEGTSLRQAAEFCLKQFAELGADAWADEYRILAKDIRPHFYALHRAEATGYSLEPDSRDGWQLDADLLLDSGKGDE